MTFFLSKELIERIQNLSQIKPDSYIYVDTCSQRLTFIKDNQTLLAFPASTSRFGIGNREGSNMTPQGIHRVTEKIGDHTPKGRIFRSRIDTGENWDGTPNGENLILSRILRLEGLEEGVNKGPGIDSYERYIYIHGTSKESSVGTPLSHGCVVLRNDDMISLFDSVMEGTIVIIN
jgi:UDP-N-acetylmuramate--alanine ligase